MKKIVRKWMILTAAAFALTGCAGKVGEGEVLIEDIQRPVESSGETAADGQNGEGTGQTAADGENGKEHPAAESEAEREARLAACVTALENLYFDQILPNGQNCGFQPGENSDITSNTFTLYDIDFDGKEELVICYWTTYTAGEITAVYGYDSEKGILLEEFAAYPALRFYDNGVIEADASHNHGMASDGAFWPYRVFQYNNERDIYEETADVDAWSRTFREEDYEGNPFPEEVDADGDGLVYYIMQDGEYELKDPVDGEEYERWRESYLENATLIEIPYVSLALENIYALQGSNKDGNVNAEETGQSGILVGQISEQSFAVNLDGWGDVTFASFEPEQMIEKDENGEAHFGDARFMLLKDGKVVSVLPGENAENAWTGQMFRQVLSVAFKDYNEDGRTDILLILEYADVQGAPFQIVRLYTQKPDGDEFVIDRPVMEYLGSGMENMEAVYQGLENYSHIYSIATSKSAWEVDRFAAEAIKRIQEGDFEGLSWMVSYPVTIDGSVYRDREEFLKGDFVEHTNSMFLETIVAEPCGNLFANYQGIMLSNGSIWIGEMVDEVSASQGLKVIGISGITGNY